jgi:hypothetical protein
VNTKIDGKCLIKGRYFRDYINPGITVNIPSG